MAKRLRVGNLMVLLQIGSMPHELTKENIDAVRREVLPHLRGLWDDEGWEHKWWPKSLARRSAVRRRRRGGSDHDRRDVETVAGPQDRGLRGAGAGRRRRPAAGVPPRRRRPALGSVPRRAGRQLHGLRPRAPGHGARRPTAIYGVDDLWDLVLIYDELLDELGLDGVPLVGHSFGGMVACEIAAHAPRAGAEARAARPDRAVARRRARSPTT